MEDDGKMQGKLEIKEPVAKYIYIKVEERSKRTKVEGVLESKNKGVQD